MKSLIYLFTPEDSFTGIPESLLIQNAPPALRVTKTALWLAIGVLMSIGMSQLN
ncbi:hypothetical protein PSDVSF_22870 [Pseudodesulfovibrio sediminis]|uniref:Uncharacterized protein n=2 Tax=Pseudodesulfovibrio sediminis TaxID=2810563 RepID=A0ABN6EV20_9BACT|nr:hypothetical protein PSDVSF_22870 [Pseudodesulfovibrio sediminis]